MTEAVLSVELSASVSEALRLFTEYPVHHLPVVRDRKLVGMLSSADVMKLKSFLPKNSASNEQYIDQRFRIETLMSRPAISVQSHQSVEDAARLMVTNAVHALPVVDLQGHLIGVITTTDMMQVLLHGASRRGEEGGPPQARKAEGTNPGVDALAATLEAAREGVLADCDPDSIAGALLYLERRVATLEEVLQLVRRHVHERQDEIAILEKALRQAERKEGSGVTTPREVARLKVAPADQ